MKKAFTKGAIILSLTIFFSLATTLSAEQECCPGNTWLSWSKKSREMYVYGYAVGYQRGIHDGCYKGTKGWPGREKLSYQDDPRNKCFENELDFSKGSDYFAQAVTQYYRQYPADRVVTPDDILQQLAQGKSLAEVHQYPFMRPSH